MNSTLTIESRFTVPSSCEVSGLRKAAMLGLSGLFLVYKYIMVVYPGVMAADLFQVYGISAAQLGNLSACYFYTYIGVQLFAGILLDKYSPRMLTTAAIALSSISIYLFSCSNSLLQAEACRALMGIGASFATLAYLKLTANWFKPKQYSLLASLLASAAMLGALFGTAAISIFIDHLGWRSTLQLISVLGMLFCLFYWFFIVDKPTSSNAAFTFSDSIINLLDVFKSRANLLISLYCGLVFSPIEIFTGMWAIPFLEQAYLLSSVDAAQCVSFSFIGLALGAPLISLCADYLQNRFLAMKLGVIIALICLMLIIYVPGLNYTLLVGLFFLFGFSTGSFMIGFAIARDINRLALIATAVAVINSFEALWSAFSDPLIGMMLDIGSSATATGNVHLFSTHSYQASLAILPVYLVCAFVTISMLKSACIDIDRKQEAR